MEPERFDDVAFRIIDGPERRPPRRHRRWVLALAASLLTAGALAAGASALTGGDEATPPAKPKTDQGRGDGMGGRHHGCHHGRHRSGDRAPDASQL
jgi:hypothetical protein